MRMNRNVHVTINVREKRTEGTWMLFLILGVFVICSTDGWALNAFTVLTNFSEKWINSQGLKHRDELGDSVFLGHGAASLKSGYRCFATTYCPPVGYKRSKHREVLLGFFDTILSYTAAKNHTKFTVKCLSHLINIFLLLLRRTGRFITVWAQNQHWTVIESSWLHPLL